MRTRAVFALALSAALLTALVASVSVQAQAQPVCPPGSTDTAYCQTVAPGRYCANVSKKKIPGQPRTPFAECVRAIARLDRNQDLAPSQVCAAIKKKVRGRGAAKRRRQRTANAEFRDCVRAGARRKIDLANAEA